MSTTPPSAPGGPTALWVLDTNAVLDWLVFDDGHMRGADAWLRSGRACWVHTEAMLEELDDVLGRPVVFTRAAHPADQLVRRVRQAAGAFGRLLAPAPRCAWACSDPDDQMFIDLALHARAQRLVTRDKALLGLARRAAGSGLRIVRPAELDDTLGPCDPALVSGR